MFRFLLQVLFGLLLAAGIVLSDHPLVWAQSSTEPGTNAARSDGAQPNVLLIGDSISMGYTPLVRQLLETEANVTRPNTNCGPTTKGLEQLSDWLGDTRWDVIHFNFGLHDLKYMGPNNENLADPHAADSHQQVPPEEYRKNLETLVGRLQQTGAELVWCATTPVPDGARGRVPGDAKRYNEIARSIMVDRGIVINDLHDASVDRLEEIQQPANVHFSKVGSRDLAKHVAAHIQAALARRNLNDSEAFEPLFDGRSLVGWVNVNCAPETWTVKDGLIHCTGKPIGELRTEHMYQNFVLDLQWRHLRPEGNAGVFVWADAIPAVGQPFHRGIEVQVLDGREADWFTSDGDIFPIHGASMVPRNGRGGDRAFPTEARAKDSPDWNQYRIVCVDGTISLAVNGEFVTHGEQGSPRKGFICLESEGSPVEFRDLRIRELMETPLNPRHLASDDTGFRTLYSGIDLSGWSTSRPQKNAWTASDWRLVCDLRSAETDAQLVSEELFGDFELVVDFRYTADSEIANASKSIGVKGVFVSTSPKLGSPFKPIGQWNRYRIKVQGERLTAELNGEQFLDEIVKSNDNTSGRITLAPESGTQMEFANLLIREIK